MLQAYNYEIEYCRSQDHGNADALSRWLPEEDSISEEADIFHVSYVDQLPISAADIASKTCKDVVLSRVLEYVSTGWPNHVAEKELQPYFLKKEELSLEHGCVLWGSRVVIPPPFQERLLHELRSEHNGISQTKAFARSYLWWP